MTARKRGCTSGIARGSSAWLSSTDARLFRATGAHRCLFFLSIIPNPYVLIEKAFCGWVVFFTRFGENDVLKKLPWFQGLRRRLSRKWKVSIALFRGQKCTLMPFRVPITVVLGRPLQVMFVLSALCITVPLFHLNLPFPFSNLALLVWD